MSIQGTDLKSAESCALPPKTHARLVRDLAGAKNFGVAMTLIERVRKSLFGDGLLTIAVNSTTADAMAKGEVELQRVWSSAPLAYPVHPRQRGESSPWSRQVLGRREIYVTESAKSLATVGGNYFRMVALGMQALISVPLVRDGRCAAAFTVFGPRSVWTPQEISQVSAFAALATSWALEAARRYQPVRIDPEGADIGAPDRSSALIALPARPRQATALESVTNALIISTRCSGVLTAHADRRPADVLRRPLRKTVSIYPGDAIETSSFARSRDRQAH